MSGDDEIRELSAALDGLIEPRPMSAAEISKRLLSTRYKSVMSDDVPSAEADGWVAVAELGHNKVLLHWPHGESIDG